MAWSDAARKAAARARARKSSSDWLDLRLGKNRLSPKNNEAGASKVLTSLYRHFPRNPMNPRELVIGKAVVQVTKWNNHLSLDTVRSLVKGQGHGSRALRVVTNAADRNSVGISLMSKVFGKEPGRLNQKNLNAFYQRHGFERVVHDEMYRRPRRR